MTFGTISSFLFFIDASLAGGWGAALSLSVLVKTSLGGVWYVVITIVVDVLMIVSFLSLWEVLAPLLVAA